MAKSLLEPFYFNKNERRGILLFLFLLLLLFSCQLLIPIWYNPYEQIIQDIKPELIENNKHNFSGSPLTEKVNISVDSSKTNKKSTPLKNKPARILDLPTKKYLFKFDPNHITKDSLTLLGVSDFAINNWIKYRNAGGKFVQAEQLLKIYGIDSSTYLKLATYTVFDNKIKSVPAHSKNKILLNQTDAIELQGLKGIGPVLSERIIKFRNALGGFHEIEQVKEVYGIPDSVFMSIKSQLDLELKPKKMKINFQNEDQLAKHPYISWKQAKLIFRFRTQREGITDLNQLYEIQAFDSSYVKKILPYCEL